MAIAKPPRGGPHPLPKGYIPPGGIAHDVKDGESWKSLAARWFINVDYLVWFNFQTNNPDEVNWYLQRNVGCTKETKDRRNYEFSTDDKPGRIYRPTPKPIVFKDGIDEFNENVGSGTDLGKALQAADQSGAIYDYLGFALNVSDFLMTGLAIGAVELGAVGLALDLLGPALAIVGLGLALGGPHLGALNEIKKDKALSGITQGIVLGAAGEKIAFIREQFTDNSKDYNSVYPEQRKNFQAAYIVGLLKGIDYGKKLTKRERLLLFQNLEKQAGYANPGDFYMHRASKPARVRRDYYIECAAKFRKQTAK